MRNLRTTMLQDSQHALINVAPRWTEATSQTAWADTLSRVRSFYCTLQKQVTAQRELIDDITVRVQSCCIGAWR